MKKQVWKIGGSCLGTGWGLRRAVGLMDRANEGTVVVLSAFAGVTDDLLKIATRNKGSIQRLRRRHLNLVVDLCPVLRGWARGELDRRLDELTRDLDRYRRHGDAATLDRILAQGERFALIVIGAHLRAGGRSVRLLEGPEAGIVTTRVHQNATILPCSRSRIRRRLGGRALTLVTGFVGQDRSGRTTTLGRGGSDYTAAYIASALEAPVRLYKDTAGLRTADPKRVAQTRRVPSLRYRSAERLAAGGMQAIHAKAIRPLRESGGVLEVRSFEDPGGPGTVVGERPFPGTLFAERDGIVTMAGERVPEGQAALRLLHGAGIEARSAGRGRLVIPEAEAVGRALDHLHGWANGAD